MGFIVREIKVGLGLLEYIVVELRIKQVEDFNLVFWGNW